MGLLSARVGAWAAENKPRTRRPLQSHPRTAARPRPDCTVATDGSLNPSPTAVLARAPTLAGGTIAAGGRPPRHGNGTTPRARVSPTHPRRGHPAKARHRPAAGPPDSPTPPPARRLRPYGPANETA